MAAGTPGTPPTAPAPTGPVPPPGADLAELALVTGDAPSAVLLVDLSARTVVHTNSVADQLAPGVRLPVGLDVWSDAARLRDLAGARLSDTDHPLSRLARSQPVLGQGVSAARVSELGTRREPLWVVALPMLDAPMLQQHALVVLLPMRHREAAEAAMDAAQVQAQLRDRAVLATGLAFTVADARAADQPLVWVNPAFTASTGYSFEEAVGRNCRFLQGSATDPATVAAIRAALDAGEGITTSLLNYRKDGTAFWNQLSVNPISGPDGELTHFVGIQADITTRVAADAERDRALVAERGARLEAEQARREAEQAQARLRLLAEATTRLAVTLDTAQCRQHLVDLVVPELADWVLLLSSDEHGHLREVSAKHRSGHHQKLQDYTRALRHALLPGPPTQTLLGGASARRISDYDSPTRRAERESWVSDSSMLDLSDDLGAASLLILALPGRRAGDDVMVLVRGPGSPRHSEDDLDIAVDLARRAGLILDNARLYEEQHAIAAALQSSLLPALPAVPGLTAAARYQAAASGAHVGGDFYELIALPDHAVGLAIGDVVGHDVMAAAAMGHLRGLLRACAWDAAAGSTAAVLERVDDLLAGLGIATMATLAYARLNPDPTGGWTLTHSSAGHPPLLLRHPGGEVEVLSTDPELLLGVAPQRRHAARHHLAVGSTLLAYTDGLVERHDEDLDTGLRRLAAALAAGPDDVEDLAEHLLATLASTTDDTALLVLRT
ncbi:SpoIIE family protein phosphatase [Aquipuribacter hungaricus]|uniref:SpoIIE family protein phosphatase n=1 Tax=Aquipuribacter hungaricus TaxID=545624 RepID=UPI0030EDA9C9